MANETLKKVFYAGVGFVALAVERVQKTIDDLVKQGKMSEEEGKKIVDDFVKTTEVKKGELEERGRKIADTILDKFDFLSKEEVDQIQNRIDELETSITSTEVVSTVVDSVNDTVADVKEAVEKTKTKAKKVKAVLVEN